MRTPGTGIGDDPYEPRTPAEIDDETKALLVEAAGILPAGVPQCDDLRRRLLAHNARIPEPALPPMLFRDGSLS